MRYGTGRRGVGAKRLTIAMVALASVSAACATRSDTATTTTIGSTEPIVEYVGSMTLEPSNGLPGTTVSVNGLGFTPGESFDLTWGSAEGSWDLQGDASEEYHGRVFTPTVVPLGSVTAGGDGTIATTFEVPDDFGFSHDVRLIDAGGIVRNQAAFVIDMQVEISPESGPPGTPITIRVSGLGLEALEGNRQILYDNRYTGWMSAVTTKGTAEVVIPATGGPGPHRIDVARGAFTFPYLNPAQSPRPDILVYSAVFTVTDGDAVLPPPIDEQIPPPVARSGFEVPGSGPWISTDIEVGPVGSPLVVSGGGFDPGEVVTFTWYRIVGNRVAGQGWEERGIDFGTVTAGTDGSFEMTTEIPSDVGGGHRLEASVGGSAVATTSVRITPAADALPQSVAWGDAIDLHLTGVGWTETANIYTIVYDNAYLGYACGFNSQGDVLVPLTATGAPGWHFVDLYPAIYKGEESGGQQSFRIPMLTYAEHPGEDLPAFHFAFFIEG
ncbi:MAG: hypothetical protein HZA58_04880 [Acidimicrobiia bacterium]|nr:hypothetical protein [Acidimicrobiia bacterium]